MNYTKDEQQAIAGTILNQLGGNKFVAMTGAYHMSAMTEGGLTLKFRGSRKANAVSIVLTPMDLYEVKFMKINFKSYEIDNVHLAVGVYGDQLASLFTRVTGLDTHL